MGLSEEIDQNADLIGDQDDCRAKTRPYCYKSKRTCLDTESYVVSCNLMFRTAFRNVLT